MLLYPWYTLFAGIENHDGNGLLDGYELAWRWQSSLSGMVAGMLTVVG